MTNLDGWPYLQYSNGTSVVGKIFNFTISFQTAYFEFYKQLLCRSFKISVNQEKGETTWRTTKDAVRQH